MLVVNTENSAYGFDEDMKTVVRMPRGGELRRDWTPVPLLDFETIEVGRPMFLRLDIRGDGYPTLRRTSEVLDMWDI